MPDRAPPDRWQRPDQLLEVGLARARVVMINEAHNGLLRSVRTREVGRALIPTAHRAGVRHLAMEALSPGFAEQANQARVVPDASGGYLSQPEMRRLIQASLDHGFTLIAYEADLSRRPPHIARLSREETNWREREQARALHAALAELPPAAKLLVWCGNGHLTRRPVGDWLPMGYRFEQRAGVEPFALDQITTVEFDSRTRRPWADWALQFAPVLDDFGGSAGFLAEDAPPDWSGRGSDAYLLSTDNALE